MLGKLKRTLQDLQAWLAAHPGALPQKLHAAFCARNGARRGSIEAHDILAQARPAILRAQDNCNPTAAAPAVTRRNLVVIVAAYYTDKQRFSHLLHNLREFCKYADHIRVYDMPENLTDDVVRRIKAVSPAIEISPKSTGDLLDQAAFENGVAAEDARRDWFLFTNDSIRIIGDLQPLFDMANARRGQDNIFSLVASSEGGEPYSIGELRLLPRASARFYRAYYDIVRPRIAQRVAACRHSHPAYKKYHLYALIIRVFEIGFCRFVSGPSLHGPDNDPRLQGANLYLHDAELFREYITRKQFPVIKLKQLQRRQFAYLRDWL